jgi:hypothetical protein
MRYTREQREFITNQLLLALSRAELFEQRKLSTSELASLPRFQTLTNRQIIQLLKESGRAKPQVRGQGKRTCYVWRLTDFV